MVVMGADMHRSSSHQATLKCLDLLCIGSFWSTLRIGHDAAVHVTNCHAQRLMCLAQWRTASASAVTLLNLVHAASPLPADLGTR